MGFLANLLVRIGVDNSDLNGGMDKATRSVNKFATDVESAGKRLTVGLTLPIAGLGLAAIKTAGEMEQTKTAFTTMMKSADEAGKHIEQLKQFALTTPFQFQDLTKASRLMQAYGFAAADVVPKLRTIGNAVSALGGGSEVLERVVRSLGEIGTRGKISGEQLRELSRAGIPALDAVAKKLGVTAAEAQKQVTAGAVDAKTALDGILEYMNTRFAGGMEAQSKTVLGSWSNLKDKITFTLADIGTALLPIAKNVMTNFLDPMLDQVKGLAEGFSKLPDPIKNTTLALGGLAAVFPLLMVGLGATITNTIAVAGAFSKLLTVLAPLATATTGAVALIAGIGVAGWKTGEYLQNKFGGGVDAATESLKRLNTEAKKGLVGQMSHGGGSGGGATGWIMDSVIASTTKAAAAVVDIDKMLADSGIKTMEQRRKDLAEAKELYAAVVKKYGEGSAIAIEALSRLRAAQEALVPSLGKVKEAVRGAFQFGEKGLDSALLVESVKLLAQERQKFVADVAKAGGLDILKSEAADNVKKAIEQLNSAPRPELMERMGEAIKDILGPAGKLPDDLQDVANALDVFGLSSNKADIPGLQRNFEILGNGLEAGAVSVEQYTRAWIALVKAMDAAGEPIDPATRREVIELEKQYGGQIRETRKEMGALAREGERFFHSLSRNIAKSVAEWKGKFFSVLKDIARDTAQGILQIFIEGLFKKLAKELADLLANTTGVLGKIGKALGGLISGGSSAAGSAAGSAASAGGSVAAGAGGAAKAASSGVMGIIGVGAQVGTMISSIVGNFQFAGMNKSLDVLVNHSLRIFNVVFQGLQEHYLFKGQLFQKLDDIWRTNLNIYDLLGRGITSTGSKGGYTFNNCTFNGTPQQGWMQTAFDQASLAGAI